MCSTDEGDRVDNLRLGLKREQQIILRDLVADVPDEIRSISDATEKMLSYMDVLDGVIIVCTAKVGKILGEKADKDAEMELEISGKKTNINVCKLQEKIKDSAELSKKILVLRIPGVDGDVPDVFPEVQVIHLPETYSVDEDKDIKTIFDYWAKHCILGRLITLKKRNRFISADSIEK